MRTPHAKRTEKFRARHSEIMGAVMASHTLGVAAGIFARKSAHGPPPCFFFGKCKSRAECEKQGKTLCEACAAKLPGQRYPLRAPSRAPIYGHKDEIFRAMDYRDNRLRA